MDIYEIHVVGGMEWMSEQKENLVFTTRQFTHNAEPVTPISFLYLRLTHSSDSLSV